MKLTRENPGGKANNGCAFSNTVITEVRVTVSDVLSHSVVLGAIYCPKWSIWFLGAVAHLGQQTRTQDTHSVMSVERDKNSAFRSHHIKLSILAKYSVVFEARTCILLTQLFLFPITNA